MKLSFSSLIKRHVNVYLFFMCHLGFFSAIYKYLNQRTVVSLGGEINDSEQI